MSRLATIFGTAVGQDVNDAHALPGEEWQYPVIEQISRCDRRFDGRQLRCSPLEIGVGEELLTIQHPYL